MSEPRLQRRPGEHWLEADGVHIEVRGLEPPGPFVAIIKLIDALDASQIVIVHHQRDPVPLYAELAERGWLAERIEGEPGEIRLRLWTSSD
jgi:hypothetical protein